MTNSNRVDSANMTVVDAGNISRAEWQSYIDLHPNGTVFHTQYLFEVYHTTPNHEPYAFFVINKKGSITAMLSGFLQTVKPGLFSKVSTRSVMLQAPIYNDVESLRMVLKHYMVWVRNKAVFTEIRNHYLDPVYNECLKELRFDWEGHYNIVRAIPKTTEQLWKEIGRKRKDGINKAKKYDFVVQTDNSNETVDTFYELLSNNYKRLRLPIPDKVFFQNSLLLDTSGYCKFFKLTDSELVGIVLMALMFNNKVYAVYIGSEQNPDFISKRPVDYFYYEVMRWCVDNSIEYFDWLGAGKPNVSYGVRDFKLQYGGELVDYGRFSFVHSRIKYKLAISGFKLLQKLARKI